jgi:hypothetical protein
MITRCSDACINPTAEADLGDQERAQLIAEVDLKWLFAGQGRWIDGAQLHTDPKYASQVLQTAIHSRVDSLHDCAVAIHEHKLSYYFC